MALRLMRKKMSGIKIAAHLKVSKNEKQNWPIEVEVPWYCYLTLDGFGAALSLAAPFNTVGV